ncbi:2Fe-2S iron-sulfur cluster binding domain-containing protein [Rhizobium sp. P38BS-XIX]|uniref:2Fe-2S iron-sulfur cluster-binding protein n=1 Tax=Rhizobium sp. P38BS-XIX TaxID=2726740 RepID=UPI001456A046|nr:2Fe-2S iron-sulfur cluster-binding protein [Rhizobium sp. P38BS-XIX]NLR97650.1 2Fe-2S iron-sulfur cluster binding domain-containing protein [Rhizobium sp. P38BS-XIX]
MCEVVFVDSAGREKRVKAETGETLMAVAVRNGIDGIVAQCGGALACGTCHCYIDEPHLNALPPPSEEEAMMIEFVMEPNPSSRLSCQILMSDVTDGMRVVVPDSQH